MLDNTTLSSRRSRSTKGCVTCARSKVKCSEDRPTCQRCSRLQRHCQWRRDHVPLRERRRGFGPVKSRLQYMPPAILPSKDTSKNTVQNRVESDESPLDWGGSPSTTSVKENESTIATDPVLNHTAHFDERLALDVIFDLNTAASPQALLSTRHIPSRCSILFGPLEQNALYFFENVFSKCSPKTFMWSKLAILLHHAYDDATVMHLLLASCLGTVARNHPDRTVLTTAKSHFRMGTNSFVDGIQEPMCDHTKTLMAFWLSQLTYRAIWDDKCRRAMKKLSSAVADYVRKHRLLNLLDSGERTPLDLSGGTSPETESNVDWLSFNLPILPNKSLAASLLLFIAYEDLDSESCGIGGNVSRLVLCGDDTSRSLFACSRNVHADYFGSLYPCEELMDDVERSKPLELHFFANVCLDRLHRAQASGIDEDQLNGILTTLHRLREEYSAIFRLAEAPNPADAKLIIASYGIVSHFHAVLVSALIAMASASPSESIQRDLTVAKNDLLRVIFRMVTQKPDRPFMWRNQWAVFIMARETNDAIHRDWLLQKLGNSSYAMLLKECRERDSDVLA
ncbi:transcription factor Cys6 [Colletotrichum scovillei]|uniref:Transcription factor Cys6 n=1 Tax=Colletotrichum scovillei TaxID=1209932 RepID=A0A9P7QXL5_9PEZI|nr:transcription factor Cys6 [Colletotrichum scovillei]KAG7052407.1 transcription factor Cys6 [Colletotrichum scovillei]KAG7064700.1 transcription factor Cys6 [Colletotrichum scovillei]